MRGSAVLGLLCALSCARSPRPKQAAPGGSAKPGLSARLLAAETRVEPSQPSGKAPPGPDAWRDAVRSGDWDDAARLLDALPESDRARPEMKFVRARVATAVHDYEKARGLLDGLVDQVPALADAVKEARAEIAVSAGPFEEGGRFFGARSDPESLVKAAAAWERAHAYGLAKAAADRAVRAAGERIDQSHCRIEALWIRARAAHALRDDASAAADYGILAVEDPETEAGDAAMRALPLLSPPARLTTERRLERARNLASAGQASRALAELDALAADQTANVSPAVLSHARGWALYLSRSDYAKAAEELGRAAALSGPDAVKDAFYAARALSRSDDDRAAIERYEAFAKQHPDSPFAEEARYQSARLHFLLGDYDAAISGYRAYLDAFDRKHRARFGEAARTELALAMLSSGKAAEAAPEFASLAAAEKDSTERASLRELEGAALADAGKKQDAVATLASVIHDAPLTLPALLAAGRLERLNETPPPPLSPPLAPPAPSTKLDVELPERVALFARLGLAGDAEKELSLHENELSARYAPRGSEALCEAYAAVGTGALRYRIGRRAVKGDVLEHEPTDATRWAWECLYPRAFDPIVTGVEMERALPRGFLHAVMRQESAFRPDAVSPANAVGLLQLMPDTAEKAAREIGMPFETSSLVLPGPNVRLGGYYLRRVFDRFGGSVPLAAAAYNAGPRAVSRWLATGENLPLDVFVARIPFAETRSYVARVVSNVARYAYLADGPRAVGPIPLELPQGRRVKDEDY
ncbi:MAG TPA: transglycosylase SLT domain-containing protein [Polyangiaceae bacterium]|nr:transglycosylase SLT domain-containing protein [Polyangiaceae bacterium]